jgi:hypothetical protein
MKHGRRQARRQKDTAGRIQAIMPRRKKKTMEKIRTSGPFEPSSDRLEEKVSRGTFLYNYLTI